MTSEARSQRVREAALTLRVARYDGVTTSEAQKRNMDCGY